MAFKNAEAVENSSANFPNIKIGIKSRTGGKRSSVSFHMNKKFIDENFPGAKIGDSFAVQYGDAENKGQVILAKNPTQGQVKLCMFGKNVFRLIVTAWPDYRNVEHPLKDARILKSVDGSVLLQMPTPK